MIQSAASSDGLGNCPSSLSVVVVGLNSIILPSTFTRVGVPDFDAFRLI